MASESNNLNQTMKNDCSFESPPLLEGKFYLVAVCGTSIATISTLENTLLFYMFVSREKFRISHMFFMIFLAFFDILISVCYILLMSLHVLMDYLPSAFLYEAWHAYLRPIFALSHVSMTGSVFLMIAGTLDRYIETLELRRFAFTQTRRILAAVIAIGLGLVAKGTVFWELRVVEKANCTEFYRLSAQLSELARIGGWYRTIWMFYFRNIATIFLPFVLLACMNSAIVHRLQKQRKESSSSRTYTIRTVNRISSSRKSYQRATRMMVLIVSMYLISNIPSVFITAWEFIDSESLRGPALYPFYTFTTDVVSLLTIICAAARLPIYIWCNATIRKELGCMLFCRQLREQQKNIEENRRSESPLLNSNSMKQLRDYWTMENGLEGDVLL